VATGPGPTPILLRSLSAAVLADGSGDLALRREARGASEEWGGVYGQLVRLTGPWRLRFWDGAREYGLPETRAARSTVGERWRSEHRLGSIVVRQEIAPTHRPAGAIRTVRCSVEGDRPVQLTVHSAFRPYLLPTLVEGIRPISYRAQTSAEGLHLRQRGFGLDVRSTVAPSHLYIDRASWIGGRRDGAIDEFGSDHELVVAPGTESVLRWAIVGGLERDLAGSAGDVGRRLADPEPTFAASEREEAAWYAATPTLRFPDAPALEQGYATARAALRCLYSEPGDSMTGLVAGYPWYSAIWCRDVAWMLPALLWLGDFDWTARSIATVLRFQSRARLPLLGGEPGELPMQISPGPIFFYGTSDTSLYFPDLAERYVRHSGDVATAAAWRPMLRAVIDWGLARTDPATGLLRNGGEAEAISAATASIARVRYGIDSPDTTIWDSTDRRDHAIDVQVLWWAALGSALALDPAGASSRGPAPVRAALERLAATIPTAYDWPEERFLADSIRAGAPVKRLRPNALRAASAGLVDAARARTMAHRAAEDDLSSAWGVRTLSARDPAYRPDAYHDGQVWPIATAWAADAALAAGDAELGVDFLARIAAGYVADAGGANECYRGDRPEPFDSCFLLGLSVGPFVSVLFERLWGLRADVRTGELGVRPCFPAAWRSATLEGLRFGGGQVTLRYSAPTLEIAWSGPARLTVRFAGGTVAVEAGRTASVSLPSPPPAAGTLQ